MYVPLLPDLHAIMMEGRRGGGGEGGNPKGSELQPTGTLSLSRWSTVLALPLLPRLPAFLPLAWTLHSTPYVLLSPLYPISSFFLFPFSAEGPLGEHVCCVRCVLFFFLLAAERILTRVNWWWWLPCPKGSMWEREPSGTASTWCCCASLIGSKVILADPAEGRARREPSGVFLSRYCCLLPVMGRAAHPPFYLLHTSQATCMKQESLRRQRQTGQIQDIGFGILVPV